MRAMNQLHELFIRNIFRHRKIFVAGQPIHRSRSEIFFQNFTDTTHHFVAIFPSELFVKILQSVNVHGKRAERLQFALLRL